MSGSLSGVGLTCCCALDGAVFSNMAAATVTYLLLLLLIFFFPSITKTWKPQVVFLPENISKLTILNFQESNWVGFQIVAGQSLWLRYFLTVYASLSQDGFQRGGFWEVSRTYGPASHFDLSWILLVSKYSLSLLHSLQDLLFKITHTSGFYGAWPEQEVSVSGSSNILNTRMCFPIGMASERILWNLGWTSKPLFHLVM